MVGPKVFSVVLDAVGLLIVDCFIDGIFDTGTSVCSPSLDHHTAASKKNVLVAHHTNHVTQALSYVPPVLVRTGSTEWKGEPEKQLSESLNKISRLPPPGGTKSRYKRWKHALPVFTKSAQVSSALLEKLHLPSMRAEIIIDDDYGNVLSQTSLHAKTSIAHYLKLAYRKRGYTVRRVSIREGSVKISYEVKRSRSTPFSRDGKEKDRTEKTIVQQNRPPERTFRSSRKSQEPLAGRLHAFVYRGRSKSRDYFPNTRVRRSAQRYQSSNDMRENEDAEEDTKRYTKRSVIQRNAQMSIQFRLNADLLSVDTEEFKQSLRRQLAREIRVPLSSIQQLQITGEKEVSFVLRVYNNAENIMDERSLVSAADDLKTSIKKNMLRLTDSRNQPLLADKASFKSSKDTTQHPSIMMISILIGMLVIMVVLMVLIGISARNASKSAKKLSRKKVYRNTGASRGGGRDSTQSLGRYSYDSGLWLGPGPEPVYEAPEAPHYRPPTRDQVSSTPRPATAVRTRLKNYWNFDLDQSLPPIPDNAEDTWSTRSSFTRAERQ